MYTTYKYVEYYTNVSELSSFKLWLLWKHKSIFVLSLCLITAHYQPQFLKLRFELLKELCETSL